MRPGKKQIRITGQRPDECPTCEGTGQTPATCTETRTRGPNGKLYTHRQGSGCPDCLGTGKLGVISPLKSMRFAAPLDSTLTWDVYHDPASVNHPHNNTTHTR